MADWQPIDTAPKDGTTVHCRWPGYNPKIEYHEGPCVWKRDWYCLGRPTEIEGWWCVNGGLPAKDPTHWRS